jgi:hypothetical protein
MNRKLLMVGSAALALAMPAARSEIIALDNADNEPYASENTFQDGQNGGTGFRPWVNLEVGTPGTMYLATPSLRDEGLDSWGLSGTYAVGRGLTEAVAAGSWSFLASHGTNIGGFCGFSLRTTTNTGSFAESEILRFGVNYGEEADNTRIYYSTNAGGTYGALDMGGDSVFGAVLEYSITWSTLTGAYTLGVRNLDAYGEASGALASGAAVAMLGAGIFEATVDERLVFDDYAVDAIPEPSSIALILLGASLLLGPRRFRGKHQI